jgi:LuxR family quorum-sensing system transcriptional regulator CciR
MRSLKATLDPGNILNWEGIRHLDPHGEQVTMIAYCGSHREICGYSIARNLLQLLPRLTTEAEIRDAIYDTARAMTFRWFALIDHVNQDELRPGDVGIYAYPDAATERLLKYPTFRHDPIVRGCRHAEGCFLWSEMSRFMILSRADAAALAFGRCIGLNEGITVPVFGSRGRLASLTFAGLQETSDAERFTGVLQMIAPSLVQHARRVIGHVPPPAPPPCLTARQIDCAILAGRGLQNKEIAYRLGLSIDRVAELITQAMRRLGVRSRTGLAVAAAAAGEFEFAEIDPQTPRYMGHD